MTTTKYRITVSNTHAYGEVVVEAASVAEACELALDKGECLDEYEQDIAPDYVSEILDAQDDEVPVPLEFQSARAQTEAGLVARIAVLADALENTTEALANVLLHDGRMTQADKEARKRTVAEARRILAALPRPAESEEDEA